jgi:hypothetical protein
VQFVQNPLLRTPKSLCRSCREFIDLQLCLLDRGSLQFKTLENQAVKRVLTDAQTSTNALARDDTRNAARPAPAPFASRVAPTASAFGPSRVVPCHEPHLPRWACTPSAVETHAHRVPRPAREHAGPCARRLLATPLAPRCASRTPSLLVVSRIVDVAYKSLGPFLMRASPSPLSLVLRHRHHCRRRAEPPHHLQPRPLNHPKSLTWTPPELVLSLLVPHSADPHQNQDRSGRRHRARTPEPFLPQHRCP